MNKWIKVRRAILLITKSETSIHPSYQVYEILIKHFPNLSLNISKMSMKVTDTKTKWSKQLFKRQRIK